jgi:hypothetical protein
VWGILGGRGGRDLVPPLPTQMPHTSCMTNL